MKIVIAVDSYKGSLGTLEAAQLIETGIRRVMPDATVVKVPIADGGEGTVDAVVCGLNGTLISRIVQGPLGKPVQAQFGILPNGDAIIEMAAASGLTLVEPSEQSILSANTYGTGELIKAALDYGCKRIYIGIGGSATNDAGAGMAMALGLRLLDRNGNQVPGGGDSLGSVAIVDASRLDPRIAEVKFIAICDVKNPLCGAQGASAVYGPQKGATPQIVATLDNNLRSYANLVAKQLNMDPDTMNHPGAGAAGGLGWGLHVFLGATLQEGVKTMLDISSFDEALRGADLVITGEGRIDAQTIYGKVPVGVAKRADLKGVPTVAIVGSIGEGAQAVYGHGVRSIESAVCYPMDVKTAMSQPGLVTDAAERMIRFILLGTSLSLNLSA